MFAGRVGGVGGDAVCATRYAGGCGGWALFDGGVEVLEALDVTRRVRSVCWRLWR